MSVGFGGGLDTVEKGNSCLTKYRTVVKRFYLKISFDYFTKPNNRRNSIVQLVTNVTETYNVQSFGALNVSLQAISKYVLLLVVMRETKSSRL
jgi:hypothetical protein